MWCVVPQRCVCVWGGGLGGRAKGNSRGREVLDALGAELIRTPPVNTGDRQPLVVQVCLGWGLQGGWIGRARLQGNRRGAGDVGCARGRAGLHSTHFYRRQATTGHAGDTCVVVGWGAGGGGVTKGRGPDRMLWVGGGRGMRERRGGGDRGCRYGRCVREM